MKKKELQVVMDAVDTYMELFQKGTMYDSWKIGRSQIASTIAKKLELTAAQERAICRCIDFDNYDEYDTNDIRLILIGRIVETFMEIL